MDVEPAYLESVASFYDQFKLEPVGENRVLVCTNISRWMRGADDLLAPSATPPASSFGACDIAPMASVNARYFGPLENGDAATIVASLRAGADVMPEKAIAIRGAAGGPDGPPDPPLGEWGRGLQSDPRGATQRAACPVISEIRS